MALPFLENLDYNEIENEQRLVIQLNAGKTPRGWGFLSPIFVQASLNKNPTLKFPQINYFFFIHYIICLMWRMISGENAQSYSS